MVEKDIRAKYPDAAYIELEPDSKDHDRRYSTRIKAASVGGTGRVKKKDWEHERNEMIRMRQMMELNKVLERQLSTPDETRRGDDGGGSGGEAPGAR